jgi:hypothetical protein
MYRAERRSTLSGPPFVSSRSGESSPTVGVAIIEFTIEVALVTALRVAIYENRLPRLATQRFSPGSSKRMLYLLSVLNFI